MDKAAKKGGTRKEINLQSCEIAGKPVIREEDAPPSISLELIFATGVKPGLFFRPRMSQLKSRDLIYWLERILLFGVTIQGDGYKC